VKNEYTSPIRRFVTHAVMLQAGIVPMEIVGADINRCLAGLDPADARRMKRKFRKMWRSILRRQAAGKNSPNHRRALAKKFGLGAQRPTRAIRLHRQCAVAFDLIINKIDPLAKLCGSDILVIPVPLK
jgi:hypothetical protein